MSNIPSWRGDFVHRGDMAGQPVARVRVQEGTNTFVKDPLDTQAQDPLFEVGDTFLFRNSSRVYRITAVAPTRTSIANNLVYYYE